LALALPLVNANRGRAEKETIFALPEKEGVPGLPHGSASDARQRQGAAGDPGSRLGSAALCCLGQRLPRRRLLGLRRVQRGSNLLCMGLRVSDQVPNCNGVNISLSLNQHIVSPSFKVEELQLACEDKSCLIS